MRRNTVRLLKYLGAAALFLTVAPVTIKLLFGEQSIKESVVFRQAGVEAHGLPVDPDDMQVAHHTPVGLCFYVDI
jgi:hypothetical protein